MDNKRNNESRERIFNAIKAAAPTVSMDLDIIQKEAQDILAESEFARPKLLAEDAPEALVNRINAGLVIGTSCEIVASLEDLPHSVNQFLNKYSLPPELKVQNVPKLQSLNWESLSIDVDLQKDNTVGMCWAEYGVAETGSFVVHSSPEMPILLNFLPLYLIAVIPKSKILHYMDDYALIASEIANRGETPRNMCLISGVSGTTDIEGVLVQGAHGPEISHIIIVEDQ
ncbi:MULTISPECIES: lactate utilization protein [unclassified Neptuniibacter]|uniref:LutC/YkgG family protein n=1 Tax=unclassified Neptuniibacter TaxID=2630693 RepID=UPI0025DF4C64|nr:MULTISPECIES: lactate utilization protein [unclassified Neptuniibacter]|tara:strand:- start:621 stop:1304 length:684 start_codon:yes stop_codon:yes gene_type:complete